MPEALASPSEPPEEQERPASVRERSTPVKRTGLLLVALISGCLAMGYAIYWLVRSGGY